jgi:CheY-like chemotaxis protein
VLLVEDEPMVGDMMAELLGGWGLQVVLMRDPLRPGHGSKTVPTPSSW